MKNYRYNSRLYHKQLPFVVVIAPICFFFLLTLLTKPILPGLTSDTVGYFIYALSIGLPLAICCLRPPWGRSFNKTRFIASILIGALAATIVPLHHSLGSAISKGIDAGYVINIETVCSLVNIFISALAIPLTIALLLLKPKPQPLWRWTVLTGGGAAVSQLLCWGFSRLCFGPSGFEFWFWTRLLIHLATGIIAGLIAGSAILYSAQINIFGQAGISRAVKTKLPNTFVAAIGLCVTLCITSSIYIYSLNNNASRFAKSRLDEFYLALANLRLAETSGLVYPKLRKDLHLAEKALLNAAGFDPELKEILRNVTHHTQNVDTHPNQSLQFKNSVLQLNQRLLKLKIPYFFSPHEIQSGNRTTRFFLRYAVQKTVQYTNGVQTVPIIYIKRDDELAIETPYLGLTYDKMSTVLVENIEQTALTVHGQLLSGNVNPLTATDPKFQKTSKQVFLTQSFSLKNTLLKKTRQSKFSLQRLGSACDRDRFRINVNQLKERLDPQAKSAFYKLTDIISEQTAIHETRHALDYGKTFQLPVLTELSAGELSQTAVFETRAYLTELIDGPLGPHFVLAKIIDMVIGDNTRANAYFLSGIVILEGLWQERIRRPDRVKRPEHASINLLPFSKQNPGWLSYSKINYCVDALTGLSKQQLRTKAIKLYERSFNEPYKSIRKISPKSFSAK